MFVSLRALWTISSPLAPSNEVSQLKQTKISAMIWHTFSARLKQGVWITRKDFPMWFRLLVWALKLESDRHPLYKLFKRFIHMYESQGKGRRNMRFVYTYLKEAYTITLGVVAGHTYAPKIGVRVGKSGLPLILPLDCRRWILSGSRRHITAILTILALHRIVPWWPPVDISTVVDAFSGITRTLDHDLIAVAKKRLCSVAGFKPGYLLRIPKVRPLELRSASPNWTPSIDGVVIDAFAFFDNPLYFFTWARWCLLIGSYWPIISLLSVLCIGWPIYIWYKFQPGVSRRHLGRLTAVYNVAGKSRIIGITNYWVQIVLFPLHRSIFSLLERIPHDGTFDQLAPLAHLKHGQEYRSYDLSAATDRIPLDVQIQALSAWTSPSIGSQWGRVISSIPFWSPDGYIKYSVGQPMGAYSSWAMLALVHHMIVQAASSDGPNRDYAVLGDDVVVSSSCGDSYMAIMTSLGVSISLAKTIISKDFVEFAKRLRHLSGLDYSVIGPGLVLAAVRNRLLGIHLFAEVLMRGLTDKWNSPRRLQALPNLTSEMFAFGLLTLFGSCGVVDKIHAIAPESGKAWYYLTTYTRSPTQVFTCSVRLLRVLQRKYDKSLVRARYELSSSHTFLWEKSKIHGAILGILHYLCLLVSPWLGVWLTRPILEKIRPRYPSVPNLKDVLPELYSQLDDLEVGPPESFDRKRLVDMLSTFRKIYPPFDGVQDWQDAPIL